MPFNNRRDMSGQRQRNIQQLYGAAQGEMPRAMHDLSSAALILMTASGRRQFDLEYLDEVDVALDRLNALDERLRAMYAQLRQKTTSDLVRLARYYDVAYRACLNAQTAVQRIGRDQHNPRARQALNEAWDRVRSAAGHLEKGSDFARRAMQYTRQLGIGRKEKR